MVPSQIHIKAPKNSRRHACGVRNANYHLIISGLMALDFLEEVIRLDDMRER